MRYEYTVVVLPEPEGEFTVEVPALRGCFSRGTTIIDALRNAEEAIECHLGSILQHNEAVPVEGSAIQVDTDDLTQALLFKVGVTAPHLAAA